MAGWVVPDRLRREHRVTVDLQMTALGDMARGPRSPARIPEHALSLGRDNRYVLEELLAYPPERIAELEGEGVLS